MKLFNPKTAQEEDVPESQFLASLRAGYQVPFVTDPDGTKRVQIVTPQGRNVKLRLDQLPRYLSENPEARLQGPADKFMETEGDPNTLATIAMGVAFPPLAPLATAHSMLSQGVAPSIAQAAGVVSGLTLGGSDGLLSACYRLTARWPGRPGRRPISCGK